jgi:hypothetical protein
VAYSDLRDYLKAKLEAIASVGTVHDYYRFLKGRKRVEAALFEDGVLNTWFIQKVGELNTWDGPGVLLTTHIVQIMGIMAINDTLASEKVFLGIEADIMSDLCVDYTWGGLCIQLHSPILKSHQQKAFANILTHIGIIELRLTERVNVS